MSPALLALIARARHAQMAEAERRRQRISFAFGNAHFANPEITWEMVERAADEMERKERERATNRKADKEA